MEFGIIRNGEHIKRNFPTHKAAEAGIKQEKADDSRRIEQGWITAKQAERVIYSVVEIKSKSW